MPKYSATTGAVYPDAALSLYENLPDDLVEISEEEYQQRAGATVSEFTPTEPNSPASVTMYQARAILIDRDLIDDVEAALMAMPEGKDKRKALAAWEYAATVDRESQFTQMLAGVLSLSEAQLDELFLAASQVQ